MPRRPRGDDRAGDAAALAFLAVVVEHVGDVFLARGVEEVGRALAVLAHAHVERALGREGEAARRLVELHRGDADVHRHAVDAGDPGFGERGDHLRKAPRVEHEARRLLAGLGPLASGGNGVGIAVESVDRRPALEDRAGVSAGAERGVDNEVAGPRVERGDHLVEEDGDVRRTHFLRPLAASAWNLRHEALARSSCGPIA